MAYEPDLDWQDNGPPGFTAARMRKMQHGIADAAQTADAALAAAGTGGIGTVNEDVRRIYMAGTTPDDGAQPGDLVLSPAPSAQGPAAVPGLRTWVDASATGARDLSTMLPDISGNGNYIAWYDNSVNPASVSTLNGLPAFRFNNSAYRRVETISGARTFSGVFAFTGGIPSADQTAVWCSGDLGMDIGARASSGNIFCVAEGSTLYDAPLAWSGGVAYVSFVLTAGAAVNFYVGGQLVGTKATSSSRGKRGSLLLSRLADPFAGVWAEFAEHDGHEATPSEVADLSAYYRDKWRV